MATTRSKVRNVFAEATKEKFSGLRANVKALESSGVDSSLDYIAFPWDVSGGGVVAVINWNQLGKRSPIITQFKGHKGAIQDICFSPFYDSIFASGSDDLSLKIWEIPQVEGSTTRQDPMASLEGHEKRLSNCTWNPIADWILASASQDSTVRTWNVETQKSISCIKVNDAVQHLKWNFGGSLLASSTKDKFIRIVDPRKSQIVMEAQAHEGSKGTKLEWLGGNVQPAEFLFTAGFEKGPGRECALWDTRNFTKPVKRESLGRGSGGIFPFWDCDTGLMFIPGRGDGNARIIDLSDGNISFCQEYRSNDSARGFGFAPKRAVDVMKCEVARMYKIDSATTIQPVQFIIPRKSSEFAEDLFPPCLSGEPALTPLDWLNNKNGEPMRSSMSPTTAGQSPFQPRASVVGLTITGPLAVGLKPLVSANSATVLQRQLTKAGSHVLELNTTVESRNKEIDGLKGNVEKVKVELNAKNIALQKLEDENLKLKSRLEELETKNKELENLFASCQMAMHAAAQASS